MNFFLILVAAMVASSSCFAASIRAKREYIGEYEYDDMDSSSQIEIIELGPVDTKELNSGETVRVPVSQLRDLLQLAIREYRRHDRNRHYMKHRRHVTSRPTDRVDPPRFEQRMDLRSDMYYS